MADSARSTHRAGASGAPVRWVLPFVCATVFAVVLNGTMMPVALPSVGRELGLDPVRLGWLISGYFLVLGVAVPFFGRVADLYGVGRLYAAGLSVFLVGSLVCLVSSSYPALLAGRFVQGAGAAAVVGLAPTSVSLACPPDRRGAAIGMVNAASGVAAASGPVLGGILADAVGWRYLFVAGVAAGSLALLAPRVVPGRGTGGGRLDWPGGLALTAALACGLLALTWAGEHAWHSPVVLLGLAGAVLSTIVLAVRQRSVVNPFVPRSLSASRGYRWLTLITFLLVGVNLTVESVAPLALADTNELAASEIGLVLLPPALLVTVWGPLAGRVVDRRGVTGPLRWSTAAALVGLVGLSTYGAGGPVWVTSGLIALVGAAGTTARIATTKAVSLETPTANLPSGMSINEMVWMVGVSAGTALFATTVTARSTVDDAFNPLHSGSFPSYSDAFLLLGVPLAMALVTSLRSTASRSGPASPSGPATGEGA